MVMHLKPNQAMEALKQRIIDIELQTKFTRCHFEGKWGTTNLALNQPYMWPTYNLYISQGLYITEVLIPYHQQYWKLNYAKSPIL